MTGVLVEPLTASPMRSLLRHRFSSRVDRALVFLSSEGEDRVVHPRGTSACPYRPPSLTMVRRKAFGQVCWVSLVEHDAAVDAFDRTPDGWLQPSARRTVTWWVSDPVAAARKRLLEQEVPSWIARDLAGRDGASRISGGDPAQADDAAARPGSVRDMECQVPEVGIAYRVHLPAASPLPDSSTRPAVPSDWGDEQRAAYRFYREVVAQGPCSLAALWLLRHPDQAREVLDWTVQNQTLLTDKAEWEHSLVGLLQGLSAADRGFVGIKLAELLSGLGIPHADEVLDRVQGGQSPNTHGYPERQ
ncbi:hypothetical protein AB0I82_03885 [Streptomyces sp. NPDC050315]|uniref:hypothetical protein n=1 Tax=Streptomyces sp. NPDC050315 TaxID=3155039 RepID=UPI00341C5983